MLDLDWHTFRRFDGFSQGLPVENVTSIAQAAPVSAASDASDASDASSTDASALGLSLDPGSRAVLGNALGAAALWLGTARGVARRPEVVGRGTGPAPAWSYMCVTKVLQVVLHL